MDKKYVVIIHSFQNHFKIVCKISDCHCTGPIDAEAGSLFHPIISAFRHLDEETR